MFTGIIETVGQLDGQATVTGGARLTLVPACPLERLTPGESIAVDGVCLTAEPDSQPDRLQFFLSAETLRRSTLGERRAGDLLNLERALRADSRLGGHLVQGHVDAVGTIRRWEARGEAWELEVSYPVELAPFVAMKGSIAVDGISLTVAAIGPDWFGVAIIPHTVRVTNLRQARAERRVNLEADVLARYAVRALEARASGGITRELLERAGF